MRDVLQSYFQMREWARFDELLVHIGFKRRFCIDITDTGDEPLTPLIRAVIGILHRAQNLEDLLVLFHEKLAGQLQVFDRPVESVAAHAVAATRPPIIA